MEPQTTLDTRFSSEQATPTDWAAARDQLRDAMTYQLTTIRADGRPHQTTIAGIWLDDAFSFTTSAGEQKAHNLRGGNHHDRLGRLVDAYREKYDDWFGFRLVDGQLTAPGAIGPGLVYDVRARKAFGFAKGDTFSQTRWRFST